MSTTIIRPQNHEEWLKIRKQGIGSSDVSAILGLNKYMTPYQLWLDKRSQETQENETFLMKAGHYLEDAVSRFWADETGKTVIKASAGDWLIRDNERPFLQVSPDRLYWLDENEKKNEANKGILEIKTTQMNIDKDSIPMHWFVQVQYQLGVSGYKHASLAWFSGGRNFDFVNIDFNEEYYNEVILKEVERFWKDCVLGGKEPETVCVDDIISKYPCQKIGKVTEATMDVYADFCTLKELNTAIKNIYEQKEALELRIKSYMADSESLTYNGDTIATWKASKGSVRFDSKAFAKDNPEIIKPYMKETQGSRRFLLK